VVFAGLSLGGCDALDFLASILRINKSNEARAQQDGVVETFQIRAATFRISSRAILEIGTNVEIKDQVTIYKQVDGNMSFTLSDGSQRTFVVVPEDIIIERPGLGLVTFIREQ
jgi:hypothetical protein